VSAPADGTRASAGRLTDDVRGGLLIILGGLCFTLVGAVIKQLGGELPVGVIALGRHVFALACFAPFILHKGVGTLRTQRYFGHFYRSAFGFISFYGLIYALPRLDLADVTALSFTAPLWSLLLSVLFLGDRIRPSRWLATAIGFGGVLLVAKPGGTLEPAMPVALGAALFSSLAMMKVKQLSATEPPDRIAFYFLLNGMLFATPLALADWQMPDLPQIGLLAAIGAISSIGQILLSRGYALGQFSKMAPMDFFRLPLAILLGFAVFAELPDLLALAGMAIIVAASLYILLARSAKPARSS
jgi:drug/metabolite transporter (DMT)-like permease